MFLGFESSLYSAVDVAIFALTNVSDLNSAVEPSKRDVSDL